MLFSIHSHWEEGELWYLPGYRYSQSVISPRLSWSNQNTSISVGVDIVDSKFTQGERMRLDQPRVQRINSSPLTTDLRGGIYEMDFESVNVTLSQRLGNIGEVYLSASKDDFENDSFSAGIHRRIFEGRNGSGEWLPPLR